MMRVEILLRGEVLKTNDIVAFDRTPATARFVFGAFHNPVGIVIIFFVGSCDGLKG